MANLKSQIVHCAVGYYKMFLQLELSSHLIQYLETSILPKLALNHSFIGYMMKTSIRSKSINQEV